jgi:hypothetical protein
MKHLSRDQQKKLNDDARLLRAWKAYHRERLDDALAGAHGAVVAELMILLDRLELNSAATLLGCIQRTDWSAVSHDVRFTVLHQINDAIARMRERNGMVPINDPLPGERDNAFRRFKRLLFPPSPADAGSSKPRTRQPRR